MGLAFSFAQKRTLRTAAMSQVEPFEDVADAKEAVFSLRLHSRL